MKQVSFFLILSMVILLFACNSSENYRLNKKYWNVDDYKNAIRLIRFETDEEEKLPCYSVQSKAPVFKKIVDINNASVVFEDEELGLEYRSEFATELFEQYKKLVDIYRVKDREDKFIYPRELVDILKFGLYVQLHYFHLGNRKIIKNADDPNSSRVKQLTARNTQSLIGNYCLYLGYVKQEKSFSEEALDNYVFGINKYFPMLIKKFPDTNFDKMSQKAKDMLKRTESKNVEKALTDLLSRIDSLNKKENPS